MNHDSRGIDVNLLGLQQFADLLAANTEQDLKPGVDRAENEIQHDAAIGQAFPGGHMAAARQTLILAMARVRDNAARHIHAAEILAVAITRALDNYTAGDRDIAGRLARIEDSLMQAVAAAQRVDQPQPAPSTGLQP